MALNAERYGYRSRPLAMGQMALVWVLLCAASLSAHGAQPSAAIKYYDHGFSPLIRVYLRQVLTEALEKTREDFGPYDLELYTGELTGTRANLETERGTLINVSFTPAWRGVLVDPDRVIQIDAPVFHGILGLRSLITARSSGKVLENVSSQTSFRQLTAGMESSWVDTDILQANKIPMVGSENYMALFAMLDKGRFDYLPLSILEADVALEGVPQYRSRLSVNSDIYLYYPLPFYLFVNAGQPQIAKRLRVGLGRASSDGTIERLFMTHFDYVEKTLQSGPKKLVMLTNPTVDPALQDAYTRRFLAHYGRYFLMLEQDNRIENSTGQNSRCC